MSVLNQLSSAKGTNVQTANIELAKQIVASNNKKAIKELVDALQTATKKIKYDSIKTLYEIGYIQPDLISDFATVFLETLSVKDNRLQWGAMTALSSIVQTKSQSVIVEHIDLIVRVANKGSVITKDHCAKILAGLCANKKYIDLCFPILNQQIASAPANQFVTYAELALPYINESYKNLFIHTLQQRKGDTNTDAKVKRLEKIFKKLNTI